MKVALVLVALLMAGCRQVDEVGVARSNDEGGSAAAGQRPAQEDVAEALGRLEESCEAGSADACLWLAAALPRIEPADMDRSVALKARACELGSKDACKMFLVEIYLGNGSAALAKAHLDRLVTRCESGVSDACFDATSLLRRGRSGIPKDPVAALRVSEKGCAAGVVDECGWLARLYTYGIEGAPKDPKLAAKYRRRACQDASSKGCRLAQQ